MPLKFEISPCTENPLQPVDSVSLVLESAKFSAEEFIQALAVIKANKHVLVEVNTMWSILEVNTRLRLPKWSRKLIIATSKDQVVQPQRGQSHGSIVQRCKASRPCRTVSRYA